MSESSHYHEILRPAVEIAQAIGERVLNLIVPPESVELIQQESLKRTATYGSFEEL